MKDNKLIAKFRGEKYQLVEDLQYHTSWDALMPVVEKIESLDHDYYVSIDTFCCDIQDNSYPSRFKEIFVDDSPKLEATYKAVVEFIKWYNKEA